METRTLIRDGVSLVYDDTGLRDAPAIIFVHGWTCDRSHFAPQAAHFSSRYRCIAVDLRGHGESDAPEQDYTVEGFADDVAWLTEQLGINSATFVGHSMGGAVVLALSHARPTVPDALVMLDAAILFPPELRPSIDQLVKAFEAEGGVDALRSFEAGRFFSESVDVALKHRLLAAACCTPQHVFASAFRAVTSWDAAPALRAVAVPLLYITADVQPDHLKAVRELAPRALVGATVGSGHFHQLEVPEQVNAMIDRFLAVSA
jgi:pimeloyl-ACP methyl ester carboxylesterase